MNITAVIRKPDAKLRTLAERGSVPCAKVRAVKGAGGKILCEIVPDAFSADIRR